MKQVQSLGALLLVAILTAGSVGNAQQASQGVASIRVDALDPAEAPDEGALRQLVGSATTGSSVQLLTSSMGRRISSRWRLPTGPGNWNLPPSWTMCCA